MALCADLVIAAEDAQIGTPYSRMWGCYLTGMWIYRLGLTKAKWHALTGRAAFGASRPPTSGSSTPRLPSRGSKTTVRAHGARARRLCRLSQLAAMKLIVNQAYENMGLQSTQTARPDSRRLHAQHARGARVHRGRGRSRASARRYRRRDGPFDDYSQAPPERQPRREHVIDPEAKGGG